ncbi:pleiotropic regulator 1, partial [Lecanoromycetidae sp. Uapishka_2]
MSSIEGPVEAKFDFAESPDSDSLVRNSAKRTRELFGSDYTVPVPYHDHSATENPLNLAERTGLVARVRAEYDDVRELPPVLAAKQKATAAARLTGGRDGVARVWDMRSRSNIHVLSGHRQTVSDLTCQAGAEPQIITSSLDATVRLWDLTAGKTMGVLTHHKKGVRALAQHPIEWTFASGSTGSIKQWKCPEGAFMQNFEGQNAIINTLSVNEDNVLFSGGDNGSISFWDWKTGHRYQSLDTTAQPGSLDAESGIFASTFDKTGLRLICGEADKTIKVWRQNSEATPETHPLDWRPTLGRQKF